MVLIVSTLYSLVIGKDISGLFSLVVSIIGNPAAARELSETIG